MLNMWTHHLWSLLCRSWGNLLAAMGTTTLGLVILTVVLFALVWGLSVYLGWRKYRQAGGTHALKSAVDDQILSLQAWGIGFLGLLAVCYAVFIVRTIYIDHQNLVSRIEALRSQNVQIAQELDIHTHSIVTTDPVFPNIIYMLQAFNIFRHQHEQSRPCVIRFTATRKSLPLASMFAQFGNSVSGCTTFGPDPNIWMNPDLEKEASGAAPGVITLHAARENAAANELLINLGNQIPVKRSYDLPSAKQRERMYRIPNQGTEDLIWLEFGDDVRWNSEAIWERKIQTEHRPS